MAQAELFDIDSPCINICEMDDKGYCKGCLRNRTERQLWHVMTDEQKHQVLRLLFIRRQKQKFLLAKLAKQAILNKHSHQPIPTYAQIPLLQEENDASVVFLTSTSADIQSNTAPAPALVTAPAQKIPTSEKVTTPKIELQNPPELKEQNLDFFEILDQSLTQL